MIWASVVPSEMNFYVRLGTKTNSSRQAGTRTPTISNTPPFFRNEFQIEASFFVVVDAGFGMLSNGFSFHEKLDREARPKKLTCT
jgi:hypothetical protein